MDYNTGRTKLIFREYGRHIQTLINRAVEVEDDELRNKVVKTIIDMMGVINPHLKNVDDYKHKLWDHIFAISDFKLVADSPYPLPTKESLAEIPERIPYPKVKLKYKHYGKNVETMVAKAVEMEDKEKQAEYALCIANYMKLVYVNWNSEDVNDSHIKSDLNVLSKGALDISDETLRHVARPAKTKSSTKRHTGGRNSKGARRNNNGKNSNRGRGKSSGGRRYSR